MTSDRRPKPNRPDDRLPPHNLEAEAALLGGALIAPRAVDVLVDRVRPEDFYKPAHQHIAATIRHLHSNGTPVDAVTVADQLRRTGLLDLVGGAEVLHELMNATPATSAAPTYARIVAETGQLRRLLHAASSIADIAYSSPDDVNAALGHAQEVLDRIAVPSGQTLSTLEVADVAALIAAGLTPEQPVFLLRTDGAALLYAGKMHMFQAEPSSGKSWLALIAAAEILTVGGSVIYLDFEDTSVGIIQRILSLGADPRAVAERFVHIQPAGAFGPAERLHLSQLLNDLTPDLVVIDGVAEALARDGYSEDKADDVVAWTERLPRWIARTGAAVLLLDHVAKDPEQRGRWARGSGAKLAVIDGATYQIKVVSAFSRTRSGTVKIIVAKDRPGGVGAIGETVAVVSIEPHAGGEHVSVKVDPNTATITPHDPWRPTILMGKISRQLEESSGELNPTQLKVLVAPSNPRQYAEALARLTVEGYVEQTSRGRSGKIVRLVRPFTDGPAPASAHHEPPPDDPHLFDYHEAVEIDEPEWMHEERRTLADQTARTDRTDP